MANVSVTYKGLTPVTFPDGTTVEPGDPVDVPADVAASLTVRDDFVKTKESR